ncbi:MAG: NUDIX hydrolase [Candidatus Adlerbacteria bacterium]|nr:NUDIX hydrolase [Candidatus Adlerbacteria bacterium]
MKDFVGSKAALFFEGKLLVYLRDNKPAIHWPNMWDFPGGGREHNETPLETIIREIKEEFSITLKSEAFIWKKEFPAMHDPSLTGIFLVGKLTHEDVNSIKFGEEGQKWQLMTVEEFLSRNDVIPHLKERLCTYLNTK